MKTSECHVGQIVHFTCNGQGRGGHYSVMAVVTKVNRVNALLTELPRSYKPGARWNWPIEDLWNEEQDRAHGRAMLTELAKLPHLAGILKDLQ
jgi:hypothetical protein